LLQELRTDPKYKFKNREEKIAYSQAALARAKAAIPQVFGLLPRADVVIQPYPKFREKNAPNEYNPGAEDGSRPAVFLISAYQAEKQSRVETESRAFHETIPGTTCRARLRSSGRKSTRSGATFSTAAMSKGGRSMP